MNGELKSTCVTTTILNTLLFSITNNEVVHSPALFWPKLGEWFPKLTKWKLVTDFVKAVQDFVQAHIGEHKDNNTVDGSTSDLIAYLQEIERTSKKDSGFYKETGCRDTHS